MTDRALMVATSAMKTGGNLHRVDIRLPVAFLLAISQLNPA